MGAMDALTDPWSLGPLTIANRVALAPLAGIGNWFVRLQARRHGAGLMFSEMVSSFALHHGNRRTCVEMLRIDPGEREGGTVIVQLFGADAEVMRSASALVAQAGADAIDLNMGCPVPKVCKTGAGAALLSEPGRAVAVARAAREGSGLPVTVKLRSGQRFGDVSGFDLAQRLVADAGVSAIGFHPRAAAVQHSGSPDYALAARLVDKLPVPVVISGGLRDADSVRRAFADTGAAAVMLARGSLGNPWLFQELLGGRLAPPTRSEVLAELGWIADRASEHMGPERAARYLRKFYPWYLVRLDLSRAQAHRLAQTLQSAGTLEQATAEIEAACAPSALAA
jgi:tRNA-dihydrouridine synthase B